MIRVASAMFLIALTSGLLNAPAMAQVITIDGLCDQVPADHKAEEGVEYDPAKDAESGIVPAGLNAIAKPVSSPVQIPVTVDLVSRFNLHLPADMELDSNVAEISVHPDGRIDYNGQDITAEATAACGQARADDLDSEKKSEEIVKEILEDLKNKRNPDEQKSDEQETQNSN